LKVQIFLQPHLSHKCISFEKEERWCWHGRLGQNIIGKKLGENSVAYIIGQPMFHEEDTTFVKQH
jgi:hypothetical protein